MTKPGYYSVEGESQSDTSPVLKRPLTLQQLLGLPAGMIAVYHAHPGDKSIESFQAARTDPTRRITDRRGRRIGRLVRSEHVDPDNHAPDEEGHARTLGFNYIFEREPDENAISVRRGALKGERRALQTRSLPVWLKKESVIPQLKGNKKRRRP